MTLDSELDQLQVRASSHQDLSSIEMLEITLYNNRIDRVWNKVEAMKNRRN